MGYRELLKNYIRHLERVTGDNFIELGGDEPVLNRRDLGELRTLAAEIQRDAYRASGVARIENCNCRLRLLMNRHALDVDRVAELSSASKALAHGWCTNPNSDRYRAMTEDDFGRFEAALKNWLRSDGR